MSIQLSNLKPNPKSKTRRKRVGRGNNASDPGNYCGRGMKGQRSRSGGKKGLKIKGLKNVLRSFPKTKGFKSKNLKFKIINLSVIEKIFNDNDLIDANKLTQINLIKNKNDKIKVLAKGELKKKLTVRAHAFSQKAEELIKKAGGKVIKIQ
ncbi:MAG: 50S ribosomal protein L15 [Patescibacteria group bacterium]|jgi:large subunit ribosomal protein L15|nr:50S ribosomal protein L15 [Patescibacteria group bacterium]